MATTPEPKPSWKEIGRSVTTPTSKTERKEVKVDDYYVVVGFEVNNPSAFVDDVQDLAIDYGHAFFYLVKNKEVFKLFSFGPKGAGKVGWLGRGSNEAPNAYNTGAFLKNGFQNARPGTADYGISEKVTAFKVPLSPRQGKTLEAATDRARDDVSSGKQKYTAYMNDTCAETARDVLSEAAIDTPSGSGIVRHSNMGVATATVVDTRFGKYRIGFTAVNPYMWHKNFKATTFASRVFLPPVDAATGGSWKPTVGSADPIF
jgi:hypothetical protein